jgi:8-oxo-dGTP pyrophosphatase MutT (NUDIX family)
MMSSWYASSAAKEIGLAPQIHTLVEIHLKDTLIHGIAMYETPIGAVLFRIKGRVEFLLMQRANNDMWDFPKGHHLSKHTEDEKAVALREIEEETLITEVKFLAGYRHEYRFINPKGSHRQIIVFLGKTDQEPVLSSEHKLFKWVTFEKACQLLSYEEKVKLLTEIKEFLIKRGYAV